MSTTRKVTVYRVTAYEVDVPVDGDGTVMDRAHEMIATDDPAVTATDLPEDTVLVLTGDALKGAVESRYDPDRGDDISGFWCPACTEIVADAEGQELHGTLSYYLDHVRVCGTEDEA